MANETDTTKRFRWPFSLVKQRWSRENFKRKQPSGTARKATKRNAT